MYRVMAKQISTGEVLELGRERTRTMAQFNIDNDIVWEEGDDPTDWVFYIEECEDEYEEPDNIDDDCGFDPYMGCYTDEC